MYMYHRRLSSFFYMYSIYFNEIYREDSFGLADLCYWISLHQQLCSLYIDHQLHNIVYSFCRAWLYINVANWLHVSHNCSTVLQVWNSRIMQLAMSFLEQPYLWTCISFIDYLLVIIQFLAIHTCRSLLLKGKGNPSELTCSKSPSKHPTLGILHGLLSINKLLQYGLTSTPWSWISSIFVIIIISRPQTFQDSTIIIISIYL